MRGLLRGDLPGEQRLPAVRVGRSFRVPAKAVREYLSAAYVETS